jgi:hypothetical protein
MMMHGLPDFGTTPNQTGPWPTRKLPTVGSWDWLTRLNSFSPSELDPLNRALVTGLMLEAMLKNPRLKDEPGPGGHRLKACLRSTLASQLAGHMSLASFHSLAQGLDHWFEVLYPLLAGANLASPPAAPAPTPPPAGSRPLEEDLFRECLERAPGLLPQRRHRKLDREKLRNFLESIGGNWFCLRDFEEHFQVGRKTAWEYVQKLLQAGLLVHNQGHSSAVRYRVAPRILKQVGAPPAENTGSSAPGSRPHSEWQGPVYW